MYTQPKDLGKQQKLPQPSRSETGGRCLRRHPKEPVLPALNLGFLASRAVSNELLV